MPPPDPDPKNPKDPKHTEGAKPPPLDPAIDDEPEEEEEEPPRAGATVLLFRTVNGPSIQSFPAKVRKIEKDGKLELECCGSTYKSVARTKGNEPGCWAPQP
ncbi:MAG: hypothetical protein AAB368_08315 [bacterium]